MVKNYHRMATKSNSGNVYHYIKLYEYNLPNKLLTIQYGGSNLRKVTL